MFTSFKDNFEENQIPKMMTMSNPKCKRSEIDAQIERLGQRVQLIAPCREYFSVRRDLDPVDTAEMRRLWKTIRGVLIRKSILTKKQRTRDMEQQIKVANE